MDYGRWTMDIGLRIQKSKVMIILNGENADSLPEHLLLVQRGLYYGDTLFESMRIFGGRMPLWERHWARLTEGMRLMGYEVPAHWTGQYFKEQILLAAEPNARVRLTVWRSPGGLYAPENNQPNYLITAQTLESDQFSWNQKGIRLGVCSSVRLPVDTFSGLKTLNAPRYVAAAREAHTEGWDDVVLLNMHDRISETTRSNLFWLEDSVFCTPPLSEGCVTGTLRNLLLTLIPLWGYAVQEKSATVSQMLQAEEVFLTNAVRGIQWVEHCGGIDFKHLKTSKLHKLLNQEISHSEKG